MNTVITPPAEAGWHEKSAQLQQSLITALAWLHRCDATEVPHSVLQEWLPAERVSELCLLMKAGAWPEHVRMPLMAYLRTLPGLILQQAGDLKAWSEPALDAHGYLVRIVMREGCHDE